MRNWLLATALSLAAAAQASPPARVEITYDVLHNGGPLATVTHVLEHDARSYRLTETWQGSGLLALLGSVLRTSRGKVTAGGLRPLEYEDQRPRRDTARAQFAWDDGILTQQFRDGPQARPLPPNAQDRLSFLFAAAFHAPGAGPIEYHVADGKGVSHYVFDVAGREPLALPAGDFDALRLVKRDDDGRSTQIWLDAGRCYLPLRVLVVQKDGARVDQVATRIVPLR
ncbi:MAG: DUF3108 domain-containing protein [Betaproteobacteria bacterium]|nr:DUF3108 domain-containing protein [Betaproteobacteria bacterium]MDH4323748.1 DUF3108 domain-containing protein [Betaproteobacteria bacterium]MDH5210835.1 DUF3108 domain-containing protein [Betaproteobacteria bacterium]MDH5577346.1 DUF3108 domain-containing protein [Betaproteobacteria bacterium]